MQALYWVWDNMCFLNRIKFIEIDCDKAAYRSDVAWYVQASTNLKNKVIHIIYPYLSSSRSISSSSPPT